MPDQQRILPNSANVREALQRLDKLGQYLTLFILDENEKLLGTLTDGDIRRGLLSGVKMEDNVAKVYNPGFHSLQEKGVSIAELKRLKEEQIHLVPVVDNAGRIIRIINLLETKSILPFDAVIMAGGEGKRLRPLTENKPKPLLKVGQKPIIEHNIDRLRSYGVNNVFISINYLGEQLVSYFGDGSSKKMNIDYVREDKPLGTLGAISYVKEFDQDAILVMNSDLLTNIDYEDFYLFFEENNCDLAIASIPYNVQVPYAVLETEGDRVASFVEKPKYTYYSNAGIYLFKKELLSLIPKDTFYNATDFMEDLIAQGKKVASYPLRGYWLDIGRHEDYAKAQEDVAHIKF